MREVSELGQRQIGGNRRKRKTSFCIIIISIAVVRIDITKFL